MVTCQSSELGWEVTVEFPADFLSLGRGLSLDMVNANMIKMYNAQGEFEATLNSMERGER